MADEVNVMLNMRNVNGVIAFNGNVDSTSCDQHALINAYEAVIRKMAVTVGVVTTPLGGVRYKNVVVVVTGDYTIVPTADGLEVHFTKAGLYIGDSSDEQLSVMPDFGIYADAWVRIQHVKTYHTKYHPRAYEAILETFATGNPDAKMQGVDWVGLTQVARGSNDMRLTHDAWAALQIADNAGILPRRIYSK